MKRLGKFTGKIYSDDYDFSNCPECCILISDDIASDKEKVNEKHLDSIKDCVMCFGCPSANDLMRPEHIRSEYGQLWLKKE